jgi:hypothetical protein
VARLKVLLAREQELANMNRASEGGGGVLSGNLAYRVDYENPPARRKSYGARQQRRNANCLRPPSPRRPPQRRTRRSSASYRTDLSKRSDHPPTTELARFDRLPSWRNGVTLALRDPYLVGKVAWAKRVTLTTTACHAYNVQFEFLLSSFKSWFWEFW